MYRTNSRSSLTNLTSKPAENPAISILREASSTSAFTGLVFLILSILLSTLAQQLSKRLIQDIGSSKKLFTLAVPLAALLSLPISLIHYASATHSTTLASGRTLLLVIITGLALVVGNFYGTQSGLASTNINTVIKQSWIATIVSTLVFGLLAYRTLPITSFDLLPLSCLYFGIRSILGVDPKDSDQSSLPTMSKYRNESAIDYWSSETSWNTLMRVYLKSILESKDSRSIFYFLCLNLMYMFVQFLYGIWTNSLGLISDAIHMLFDCMALAVGLFAAVMAKWSANKHFSFGYSRIETLSGFANGIFLVFISLFILIEGIERLLHPPEMNTDRLLLVAVMGFLVNMVGIFSFHHGHGHGHSHDHGEGHDHHHDNANMQGVFLHILADALGSFGVIVSTLLIYQFSWTGFDPLASLLIAILIFISTLPLIQLSFRILMLKMPAQCYNSMEETMQAIKNVMGVVDVVNVRCWANDGVQPIIMLTVCLSLQHVESIQEQSMLQEISSICEDRFHVKNSNLTVEFEWVDGPALSNPKTIHAHHHPHDHSKDHEHTPNHKHTCNHSHDHDHKRPHSQAVTPVDRHIQTLSESQNRRAHSVPRPSHEHSYSHHNHDYDHSHNHHHISSDAFHSRPHREHNASENEQNLPHAQPTKSVSDASLH